MVYIIIPGLNAWMLLNIIINNKLVKKKETYFTCLHCYYNVLIRDQMLPV